MSVEVGDGHAITCVFRAIHQGDATLALHRRHDGVTEEPRLWPELADDGDLVCRRNVVESGYRWMMRNCRRNEYRG